MGSGMPEIGSRISLISKADIRYEGKLFSVDPEECTIALSSVRSYGTEDRETAFPVPAQSQVYDYILFRGTDIKDIRVLSTTIPNDPAIVQLSVPPSLSDSQFQSRTNYSHPSMSMPNAPSTSRDQSQSFPSSFAGVVNARTSTADLISGKSQSTQNVPSEDDSRSSTPSTHHAKGNDANARVSGSSNAEDSTSKKSNNNYNRDRPQSGNRYQQAPRQQYQQRYQQQGRYQNHQSQQQQQSQPRHMQQQQSHYRDFNRDNQYRNYNDYRDSYGSRQGYMQPMRNQQRGDGWNSYNYDQRNGRNRMGQNGQQRINYQSTGYQNQNRRPRNTLKFEDDFDFEQANSEFEPVFEQLRSQLEKTKLNDEHAADSPVKMNGDIEGKKEDGMNDAGSGGEENEVGSEEKPQFYDKVKSFFDQISYEAIERSKGNLTTRVDWKAERKINSETFGQLALRRNNHFYGRGGQNGGNYYNHQNRNQNNMGNNYRGRYNRPQQQQLMQQPKPMNSRRGGFNSTNKSMETAEARTT